jgi:hypothetical protein
MTIKQAKQILRDHGMTINKTAYGDYRVNAKNAPADQACFTDDLDDAVGTGIAMAQHDNALTVVAVQ